MDLITSKVADPQIFKTINILMAALELKQCKMVYQETRCEDRFIYFIENKKHNITGYIGRDKEKNKIVFVGQDESRIRWSLLEGFTRDEAFEQNGVLFKMKDVTEAVSFFGGGKDYTVVSRFTIEKQSKAKL